MVDQTASEPAMQQVLNLRLRDNDADAETVREYLLALLAGVWEEGEEFSGKRPFGNSSWEYELYSAVVAAGFVAGTVDDDGYLDEFNRPAAHALIAKAIDALGQSVEVALPNGEILPPDAEAVIRERGQRVSHADLMDAAAALGRARDAELAAGEFLRGREINQLALSTFIAAIRVEDIVIPGSPS